MRVAGRCLQRRMQHLRHFRAPRPPRRQGASRAILRLVADRQGRQRAQQRFDVVGADAPAHAHVGKLQPRMQRFVARRHRPHQHVAAAGRELGQRMHRDVDGEAVAELEGMKRDTRAPGVVERHGRAVRPHQAHQRAQIGKLHRHRARRLQPHQLRRRRQHLGQRLGVHRIVEAVPDAPLRQLVPRQLLAGVVGVVGDQHLVARLQQGHVDQCDRRQAAGQQQRVGAAFQRRDALFQREGRRRAVQPVGVARLVAPSAVAHRGRVGEDDRRGLVHAGLRRGESGRRVVGVVDQRGAQRAHRRSVDRASLRISSWLPVKRRCVMSVGKNMPQVHSTKRRSLRLSVGICER